MSGDTNITSTSRCQCCLSKSDDKHLQTYYIRHGTLRSVFQTEQLQLCFICKKIAQQTELFINNVQNHQMLFRNIQNFTYEELENIQQNVKPVVKLATFLPANEDITYLSGKEDQMKVNKFQIQMEYVPGSEKKIKKEKSEDVEKPHRSDADSLEGYDEVVSSDVTDDDEDLEFYRQYMTTVSRRIKRERNIRGLKIKAITISKSKLMEERSELAKDPRYMEAKHKCTDCIKWFVVKSSFDKHMDLHKPSAGKHECDVCKQRMATVEQLNSHYSRHIKRFQCGVCDITRKSQTVVKSHFMMHHCGGLKEYACSFCGQAYSNKTSLHRHKQIKHSPRPKVTCEFCKKKYADKASLWSHLITRHAEAVCADVKRPTCAACGRAFGSRGALKAHCCAQPTKKFYCAQCDKSFASKFKLQTHLSRTGTHTAYENLRHECEYCVRRFLNRRDVERHVNGVHLNVKSFKCNECDKMYADKRRLTIHTRTVHEGYVQPKNHACTLCNKLYQEKKSLEAHLRTHTGEKPFQCSQCAAQFTHNGSLHNHVKLVHLNLPRNRNKKKTQNTQQANTNTQPTQANTQPINMHQVNTQKTQQNVPPMSIHQLNAQILNTQLIHAQQLNTQIMNTHQMNTQY